MKLKPNKSKTSLKNIPDLRTDHRQDIGGAWDHLGRWQFDLMIKLGLKPHHSLLDVGCGSLRGGVHFIRYLDDGNYTGIEQIEELVQCGIYMELTKGIYNIKKPTFYINDTFDSDSSEVDYIICQSLASHLIVSEIDSLLGKMSEKMNKDSALVLTFFERFSLNHMTHILRNGKKSFSIRDRHRIYYHSKKEIAAAAKLHGLIVQFPEDIKHPRGQTVAIMRLENEN